MFNSPELPGSQDKKIPQKEMSEKFPEIPAGKLEKPNFKPYVVEILGKEFGRYDLAMLVDEGKINIDLDTIKSVEMTNIAEKYAENHGSDFDSTDIMLERARIVAKQLVEQYPKKE